MNIKKVVLFLLCSLVTLPLMAQQNSLKIGVVDAEKILRNSVEMQKAYKDIQTLIDKKSAELKKKQEDIAQLEDKYKTQASVLSSDARGQLEEKIRKGYTDIDKFREDSKIEIQTKETSALSEMEKKVSPLIQQIGNQENFTLILRKEMVVFMSETIDITDKIVALLNEAAPKPQQNTK
ncbi:MAG: hypothetical protein A2Y62_14130 [Candidatus Fischerbacteria bacterium RBG_13_37_8]|uniref:Outer membrane chaperone Skp n=1 Tax=Candidatus Fischerbacteria bacterium RBG_13_37_8 TaxID=1817863 RepID=A0A1F5VFM0_9BACT|nr:MAG: hypothetical protein A2Y62_14130 [Candidatus Fischerbacteria bacterium RBG_13_37_8]